MDKTLQHWGIKGMRWGVRRYQNKDGSLTPAGKKRREQEEAKAEEAKRQREEAKQKAIRSGTATEVMKFRGELDSKELQTALDRLDREKRIRDLGTDEMKNYKSKTDKFFDKVGKATKYAEVSIKAWNTIANIHNALNLEGRTWAKIDTDIVNNNKKLRKDEKAAKEAKEKKAREKAKKEAAEKKVDDEINERIRKSEEAERQRKERERRVEEEIEENIRRTEEANKVNEALRNATVTTARGEEFVIDMASTPAKFDDIYTENGRRNVEEILKRLE